MAIINDFTGQPNVQHRKNLDDDFNHFRREKYMQLIVEECINIAQSHIRHSQDSLKMARAIRERFGLN